MVTHDLSHPDFDPPDCPAWAKETLPDEWERYKGRNGMLGIRNERRYVIAPTVRGLDRYHANQFVFYRPETHEYLYQEYTPLEVGYTPGLLPIHEALACKAAVGAQNDAEKAQSFLQCVRDVLPHPEAPPFGTPATGDRNLDDEALLASGTGWCNEQARTFIRLCQVSGIPARIVQLFYSNTVSGHCVAEAYLDGKWAMADASWRTLLTDASGRLLSAAECHATPEGRRAAAKCIRRAYEEVLAQSDEALRMRSPEHAAETRAKLEGFTEEVITERLDAFGIINYPLPH